MSLFKFFPVVRMGVTTSILYMLKKKPLVFTILLLIAYQYVFSHLNCEIFDSRYHIPFIS